MDYARADLGRILHEALTNPHQTWLNGSDYFHADQPPQCYTCRCAGVDDNVSDETTTGGETSLHRFLALHTTCSQSLTEFLIAAQRHYNREEHSSNDNNNNNNNKDGFTNFVLHQNHAGATALHVALHRNSFHAPGIVETLLTWAPLLARIPTYTGTYPLHVVTGHSLTLDPVVLARLVQSAPEVALRQDAHGDTPLSLWYKNVRRFRWARAWETSPHPCSRRRSIGTATLLAGPQVAAAAAALVDIVESRKDSSNNNSDNSARDLSCMTIIAPQQFLEGARQLLQAAHTDQTTLTWHHICATDRCPPLLIRMMLQQQLLLSSASSCSSQCTAAVLEEEQNEDDGDCDSLSFIASTTTTSSRRHFRTWFQKRDAQGRLPLHWAAMAQAVSTTTTQCVPSTVTVVELILAAHPAAAAVADATGRYPLHYAVANRTLVVVPQQRQGGDGTRSTPAKNSRHPLQAITALARTYFTALTVPDPVTLLYPVLQLAASMEQTTTKSTNIGSKSSKISLDEVEEEEDDDDDKNDDCIATDVLYRLLLAHPDVCCYHRPRHTFVK